MEYLVKITRSVVKEINSVTKQNADDYIIRLPQYRSNGRICEGYWTHDCIINNQLRAKGRMRSL